MQTIFKLLTKERIDDILLDIKKGRTCVLMKPKGVKLVLTSPPKFTIADKTNRSLNTLDLLMTDLYVQPYMHTHKIKSKLIADETYELVHNYDMHKIFITSVKEEDEFVNDYQVMEYRANLYDLDMPTIPKLNMEALTSLITSPETGFAELGLANIANAVMFLNSEYQAILDNPLKEKSPPATTEYIKLVNAIFKYRPASLHENIHGRFVDIFYWAKRVQKNCPNYQPGRLKLPKHTLELQDFTLTFLPSDLYEFMLKSKFNTAVVRTIMMIIAGKGYKEDVHIDKESSTAMKDMCRGLDWEL